MPFVPDSAQPATLSKQTPNTMGWLPNATGIVGQALGGLIGGAGGLLGGAAVPGADLTGVPEVAGATAGERIGQTAGSALGQGGGEFLRELLTGQKASPTAIAGNAGQGALWAQLPGGKAGASVAENVARRAIGGVPIGAGVQALQNIEQGKPIGQNVGLSGGVTGAVNAILPGVTSILGKAAQPIIGSSDKILSTIAKHFFGDEASRDPQLLQHMVTTAGKDPVTGKTIPAWQMTRNNIANAMQDVYKPLAEALSNKKAKLGDFLDAFESGRGQENISSEVLQRNIKSIADVIARKTGGDLSAISSWMSRPIGQSVLGRRQQIALEAAINKARDTEVPLNVLNEAKQMIGDMYKKGDPSQGYTAVKKFIEDKMGSDVKTKDINAQYNKLRDAKMFLEDQFAKQTKDVRMNSPMNFQDKIALLAGSGFLGALLGLPSGSIYSGGLGVGSAAFLASELKNQLLRTPERAGAYAKTLQKVSPTVDKAVQQLLLRGGQQLPNINSTGQ